MDIKPNTSKRRGQKPAQARMATDDSIKILQVLGQNEKKKGRGRPRKIVQPARDEEDLENIPSTSRASARIVYEESDEDDDIPLSFL